MPAIGRFAVRLRKLFRVLPIDQLIFELRGPSGGAGRPGAALAITRHRPDTPSGIASLDDRLTEKRVCYLVREGDAIVHESWLCFDVRIHAKFGFDPKIPVIGYCETDARYRGRGIYPTVLRRIADDEEARRPGRPLYVLVSPDNAPSIRGIEHAGARRIARLTGTLFLGRMWRKRVEAAPA
jgi:hypothetical protein